MFLSSPEQKFSITSLVHNGSSAVNGCRQNESKQLIKTSNPQQISTSTFPLVVFSYYILCSAIFSILSCKIRFCVSFIHLFLPVKICAAICKFDGFSFRSHSHSSAIFRCTKQFILLLDIENCVFAILFECNNNLHGGGVKLRGFAEDPMALRSSTNSREENFAKYMHHITYSS